MERGPDRTLVLDTSVLVNFLAIDRMDLLARFATQCLVTDHVRAEILDHYQDRYQRFQTALASRILMELRVDRLDELETFATLSAIKQLGSGECSAIALAVHRQYELAIDDRRARNEVTRRYPTLSLHTTQEIMVALIHSGVLELPEADSIRETWANEHSFRLKIRSFAELL